MLLRANLEGGSEYIRQNSRISKRLLVCFFFLIKQPVVTIFPSQLSVLIKIRLCMSQSYLARTTGSIVLSTSTRGKSSLTAAIGIYGIRQFLFCQNVYIFACLVHRNKKNIRNVTLNEMDSHVVVFYCDLKTYHENFQNAKNEVNR